MFYGDTKSTLIKPQELKSEGSSFNNGSISDLQPDFRHVTHPCSF